jgi:hypothetical protein
MKTLRQRLNRLEKFIEPEEEETFYTVLIYGREKELVEKYEQITGKAFVYKTGKKQETESVEKEPTPKLPDNVIPFKPLSKLEELQKTLQTVNGIEGELNRLLKKK